ncbi:iron-containing redox enzyme family protein [Paenibacillus aurantius]|uniref:Iron-containing redox enzyme family protein n=1 Tax=Paenibacillus aurantius TaxID=2918900 RepID=A0AA96LHB0_9BACL|nr:iron-containing redox enzyme family protein [Paenibacillus aurantius]WJH36640.1 iron-containing redox enzyme family protein [Paenibacillus sp. CC-CFT747]WNQ11986.1 iron-containing redox enzyme family protein [Paenibacillus aurantius]
MTQTVVVEKISGIIAGELARVKQTNRFFAEFPQTAKPEDFKWCVHLYHLSKHFGELLKLRWERFPDVDHDVFSTHYEEEKDHAQMLRKWMMDLGLEDPELSQPNYETEHFISLQYRAVASMSENLSLLIVNSTSEGFAHAVYLHATEILKKSGFENLEYWEVHCEADEEHSNVYHLIKDMSDAELQEAEHLVRYTCDTLDKMLNSWFA